MLQLIYAALAAESVHTLRTIAASIDVPRAGGHRLINQDTATHLDAGRSCKIYLRRYPSRHDDGVARDASLVGNNAIHFGLALDTEHFLAAQDIDPIARQRALKSAGQRLIEHRRQHPAK